MVTKESVAEIIVVNKIIRAATDYGGDAGGPYCSDSADLEALINEWLVSKGYNEDFEVFKSKELFEPNYILIRPKNPIDLSSLAEQDHYTRFRFNDPSSAYEFLNKIWDHFKESNTFRVADVFRLYGVEPSVEEERYAWIGNVGAYVDRVIENGTEYYYAVIMDIPKKLF